MASRRRTNVTIDLEPFRHSVASPSKLLNMGITTTSLPVFTLIGASMSLNLSVTQTLHGIGGTGTKLRVMRSRGTAGGIFHVKGCDKLFRFL